MSAAKVALLAAVLGLGVVGLGVVMVQGAGRAQAQTPVPAPSPASPPAYTPGEESPEEFPAAPGRDETFYACIACHNFKLVAAQGMNRERWDDTLTFMTVRHNMPEIGAEDRRLILDYLATAFPERAQPRGGWRNPFAK